MTEPGFGGPPTDARWGRMAAFRDNYGWGTRPKDQKSPKDRERRRWYQVKRRSK